MELVTLLTIAALVIVPIALVMSGIYLVKTNLTAMDLWMKFPLIGTMARLARNPSRDDKNNWFKSELELCEAYHKFIKDTDEQSFDEQREYMRWSGDSGRQSTPLFLMIILFLLVVAESFGFSLLLGDVITGDSGTATQATVAAWGIVFVLAVILVFWTHLAGHSAAKSKVIQACRKESRIQGTHVRSSVIDLTTPQKTDNGQPDFVRCSNRITSSPGETGSYLGPILLWVVILGFAAGMVLLRMHQLDLQLTEQTSAGIVNSGDPFATNIPAELAAPQGEADNKAASEIIETKKSEGFVGYVILSMIFLMTQAMGFGIGYRYSFLGAAAKYYDKIAVQFPTYRRYQDFLQPFIKLASQRLVELQNKMPGVEVARRGAGQVKVNTFGDFCQMKNQEIHEKRMEKARELAQEKAYAAMENTVVAAPVITSQIPPLAAVPQPASAVVRDPVQEAKDTMIAMNDPAKEKEYFLSLPPELKANPALQDWLKERRQQRLDAQKQVNVDDLF